MPRKFHLVPHLTVPEVTARERRAATPEERSHWQLVRLVMGGETVLAAAATVGYHERYARELLTAYNQKGPHALVARPPGRPRGIPATHALLDDAARARLDQALHGPAPDGGLWTGPKVARWIAAETGRDHVHDQRGWDYLRKLGFVLRRPRPRHAKADPAAQAAFKKA